MIKIKTKKQIRKELQQEVHHFLSNGGAIKNIAQGESGKELGANINRSLPLNPEKQSRTPLTDEVKALDDRKLNKIKADTKGTLMAAPKKKIIYDDFGEPLREVWE